MNCPSCGAANPGYFRFCRVCGGALGGAPAGDSERRVATVLFADMSGFTSMSERLDPEQVHEIINDFLGALAACVQRYGGTIDKYIGDEIMAVFGAPRVHEDDPERALATALEMRESMRAVNERHAPRLPRPAGLHVGVNTGLVIAGRVGDASRSDYTVIGDTVNLASRLADLSESGQIIVSEHTWGATRHAFAFQQLEPARVKGKDEPIPIYALLGRRARRVSRRGVPGVTAPLVGRDAELATLTDALARLEAGAGGFVALMGPAGTGKSRLLAEARTTMQRRRVRWVEAACASLGQEATLAVWAEALRRLLGLSGENSRRPSASRLTGGTRMISLDEARDASVSLANLLRIDMTADEQQRAGVMDDEAMRLRLFLAVRDLLEGEASRIPLVLVLDDLHWADSASLKLLQFVLDSVSRVPLLIIAAFRNDAQVRVTLEEALDRVALPSHATIELDPLSRADSETLAERLLGPDPSLAEIRALLVEYSEGNPFFLEEVLRSLIDQGVLRNEDGVWRLSPERGSVVLSESLQGLLLDRIDRLPESSKRLLQIAAVIGRAFPAALLGEISGMGAAVGPALVELEQAAFVERGAGEGDADHRFRHALIQEAAYSSLLHRHRRDYHRRVAEWYERHIGAATPSPEAATMLAHHWERAESWAEAGCWALRAAEGARRAFALDEAAALYERARQSAERAGDTGVLRAAEQGLGEVAFAGGAPEAAEHLNAALALATEPLDRAAIERRLGQVQHREGRYDLALAAFGRAAEALGSERRDEPIELRAERARLRVARAATHLRRGDEELAQLAAESALRAELPPADRADAAILLGDVYVRREDDEQSAAYFQEALTFARESGNPVCIATVLERIADTELRRRRLPQAKAALAECLSIRQRLGDHAGCAAAFLRLARINERDGQLLAAVDQLRAAITRAVAADDPVLGALAQLRLGEVLRLLGNWRDARAALERAGQDDPEIAGRAALELAWVEVDQGGLPEAALRQVVEEGDARGMVDLATAARLGLATLARRRRRFDEARSWLRQVLTAGRGSDGDLTTQARIGLAELAIDERRGEVAVASARMALEAAKRTGPAIAVWRAQRRLGAALGLMGRYAEAERELRAATEATRPAEVYPELARGLADWAAIRTLANGGTPDAEAQRMVAEMRDIWDFLAGAAADPAPPGQLPGREPALRATP